MIFFLTTYTLSTWPDLVSYPSHVSNRLRMLKIEWRSDEGIRQIVTIEIIEEFNSLYWKSNDQNCTITITEISKVLLSQSFFLFFCLKWQNINYYYNKGVFIILTIFPPPTHHFLPTDGGEKNSEFNKIIFIFPHLSCQRYEKKIILFLHFSPRSLPFQTKWRDFQHRLSCTVFFLNSFLQWKRIVRFKEKIYCLM